jgi:predicted dienelactone hydrolase
MLDHICACGPDRFSQHIAIIIQTSFSNDLPGAHIDHFNRALDVKFMLDSVLKSSIAKTIDKNRIGFIGYSLGGLTGMELLGARVNIEKIIPDQSHVNDSNITKNAQGGLKSLNAIAMKADYNDPRIKSAFLMAPAWAWAFDPSEIKQISKPVFIIAPENDEVLVTKTNGLWLFDNLPNAQFQMIAEAGHFVFLGSPTCEAITLNDSKGLLSFLYKDKAGIDRQLVQEHTKKLALEFFKNL